MSQMRIITAVVLTCAVFAADTTNGPSLAPVMQSTGCMAATTNRVDPVSGAEVDIKVPIIHLKLNGGDVVIGFANAANRDVVLTAEAKTQQLYAQAASANKIVKGGMVVDVPKVSPDATPKDEANK